MGDMADLISGYGYDYDDDREDWYEDSVPFKTECKWCGKRITMTPTDTGWRPIMCGKPHFCEERAEQDRQRMISQLPDLDEAP